ncbi:MAG: Gfo/Idh/MocA family oxidoreductase [Eubacteriales bacterium]
MKFGILGCGNIVGTFMKAVDAVEEVSCIAVASRELSRAENFAKERNIPKAYGSYGELLADDQVEAVYIATPHSHHYEHMKLCIQAGKHILCEKAFTVNGEQGKEILALAKEKKVFVLEGMWPRFFPMVSKIQDIIKSERLGKAKMLSVSKCYPIIDARERCYEPALAGGAVLDLGCYVLNFASMFFGDDVTSMKSVVSMTNTGVDLQEGIILHYGDGKIANLSCSMGCLQPEIGIIACEKGYIKIPSAGRMERVEVYNEHHELLEELIAEPFENFQYEVAAMAKAVKAGKLECEEMSHQHTIFILEQMDALRKEWGFALPCE